MEQFNWKEALKEHAWEEGKVIDLIDTSYRTRTSVTCYSGGRQKAVFSNGEHNYGAYTKLIRPDGSWISHGAGVVPVLPDGRLVMVVEQRPPQGHFEQATTIVAGGQQIDLQRFGPYSSLEFPGGAIDQEDKSFRAGFLRELEEETGAVPHGTVYMGRHLVHAMGSDIALGGYYGVIYLSGMHFESYTKSDGGLHVFALTEAEVWLNFHQGNIRSGQATLLNLLFYAEIEKMRHLARIDHDFVSVEEVALKK